MRATKVFEVGAGSNGTSAACTASAQCREQTGTMGLLCVHGALVGIGMQDLFCMDTVLICDSFHCDSP